MSELPELADDEGFGENVGERPDALIGSYYRGTVVRLSFGLEMGIVRSATGREIAFAFQHVETIGCNGGPAGLRRGQTIGFDVGWTGRGLRVTRIRCLPPTAPPRDDPAPTVSTTPDGAIESGTDRK